MVDGVLEIGTSINLSGIKKDLKELESELARTEKEWQRLEEKKKSATKADEKIIEKDPELKTKAAQEAWQRQVKAIQDIEREQAKVLEQQERYKQNLDAMRQKYADIQALSNASSQVDQAIADDKFISGITTQKQYNSLLSQTRAEMARIEAHAARISAQTGRPVKDILAVNANYQKAASTAKLLETRSKHIANNIKRAKKETKGLSSATKTGLMGFGKMQLAMMGIMFAMRAVSAATQEYMSVNKELEGQMNTLRALWGQVLGPVIEWVINLLIKAISVVNAFVHALTGINFVARANAAALKKQAQASGGGSGNQTAGFDEQTKLTDSGGGGSGDAVATLPDGTSMDLSFLDPLMAALRKFKEDVTPLLNTIGAMFKWIWVEILVPFGNWALNSLIPGFLNVLGGVLLTLNDAILTVQPVLLWLWDNILAPIAEWTGGVIVDVLNGIGDWLHEHHETLGKIVGPLGLIIGIVTGIPTVIALVTKALGAVKLALAALTSPVGLVVAAVTALIAIFVTCYDECEGFRKGMDQVWQGIKDIFFAGVDFVKALFKGDWAGMDAAWAKIKEAGQSLWQGLVEGLKAGWEWAKQKVTDIWNKIVTKFKEIFGIHSPSTLFRDFGKFMIEGLVNGLKNALSKVTNACKEIWSAIKSVFSSVGTWFKDTFSNAWQKVKDVFSSGGKVFDGIKDGIASTFKTIVNGLISGINRVIAVPFNSINGLLNTVRGISVLGISPFKNLWGYNPLSVPQIPMLARGAIVNRPGKGVPAIVGEAGREAVLPLDNHTEWMDILADKIGGGTITIPIYIDGKKMYTYIVDVAKRKAFAANGG